METEKELNDAILKMTLKIQNEYPELSKYLIEMPVTIPDIINPKINIKTLKDYYESLNSILKEYVPNHIDIKDK
ncbi:MULTISPECIES: hypothetical protein [Flavobacterium]|uniref:Uncharacterized protein n=1 Tax=Flavobacterium gawalongense TaxID=2594432 RepID=A0A553BPF7_9FLAO|nr:hypothetical protein [Flavobacterium gawalongense]TRX01512.1 hypothetical protein FNW33_08950 [Flavobacterium gawalongense]TRX06137.1 hypothetical protein FNW12_09335 [Flavobacterium gawalongense]TRX10108.1 hypothetical protein FNW11_08100 [Flavobacterium gawalongense]TRX11121.1 hypothetical protein FNW10_07885 [Flavobacterium gawalongense]TRX28770.1 hypothetical protein FNW38_07980 [Flavobacterium gawalongense]